MAYPMHASVLFASFLLSLAADDTIDMSCARTDCAAANGTALLQLNRGTRIETSLDDENEVVKGSRKHCGLRAANVPLTSKEYQLVKEGCCLYGMADFVRQVTETVRGEEPYMGYKICFPGFAPGVALWHGCEGDGKDSTFQDLLEQIVRHADDPCTAIAKPGQACPAARPPNCKQYPGTKPKNCGCSQSKSVPLDFTQASLPVNDLAGLGPGPFASDGSKVMRFAKVGKYGTPPTLDFDIVVEAQTPYTLGSPTKSQRNTIKGEFGKITMTYNQEATFTFTLTEPNTYDPIEVKELSFTVFDIDGTLDVDTKPDGHQYIRASDFSGYVVEDDTRLAVTNGPLGQTVKFEGKVRPEDGDGRVPNPDAVNILSNEQRKVAVMLIYKNVSTFDLTFGVSPLQVVSADQELQVRDFYFAGMSALGDHCGP